MQRALILGISGQDGAYMAKELLAQKFKVFGITRNDVVFGRKNLEFLGISTQVQVYQCPIYNSDSLSKIIAVTKPSIIFDLSGQTSVAFSFQEPEATHASIVHTTAAILELIKTNYPDIRYFFACSSECFGNTLDGSAIESTVFSPLSPYAKSKKDAFDLVQKYRREYGLFVCAGILSNHESVLRKEVFVIPKIIKAAARISVGSREKLFIGNINIIRDWGWAPDYVQAMFKIAMHTKPQDYIISTGKSISLEQFLRFTFGLLNLDFEEHIAFDNNLLRPNELSVSRCNSSKIYMELGWRADHDVYSISELLVRFALNNIKTCSSVQW